jgi:hypothetical protein
MSKRIAGFIFVFSFFASCKSDLRVGSSDIVITERLFSPDSGYVAITFYQDYGAMGQSLPHTALMKAADTMQKLTDYTLPCFNLPAYSCYYPDKWLDDKTLQVYLNERPFVKAGIPFEKGDVNFKGVQLKVVPYDNSYHLTPLIEHFSLSNNKQKLLIAYRYRGVSELNLSVINVNDSLPRIGNILAIAEISWNPILFATWQEPGINVVLSNAIYYNQADYLNKGITLPVRFIDINDYKGRVRERSYWCNSDLYNDIYIDSLLDFEGEVAEGKIVETMWGINNDHSMFFYEYEYTVNGRTFRSYFNVFKEFKLGYDFSRGDKFKVIYYPQ